MCFWNMLPGFGMCAQQLGMSYLLQQLKDLPSAALRAFWPPLHSRPRENVDKISVKTIICTHLSLKHLSELSFLELSRWSYPVKFICGCLVLCSMPSR